MRIILISLLMAVNFAAIGQSSEKIEIPKGVVYKYCDSLTYENAKSIITRELSASPTYSLNQFMMITGPVLWSRFGKINALKNIKGGDVTILGYKKETSSAKATQNAADFKLIWDQLRAEIGNTPFKLRKANVQELKYYWSIISFDIEEPLIIIETPQHNYIVNLEPKDMTLAWLDEAPRP